MPKIQDVKVVSLMNHPVEYMEKYPKWIRERDAMVDALSRVMVRPSTTTVPLPNYLPPSLVFTSVDDTKVNGS